jgi:hypothetical protein
LLPELRIATESNLERKDPVSKDLSLPEADPSSGVGADRARADLSSGAGADPNSGARAGPNFGAEADRAWASLSFEAGADLSSAARASPSFAAKADLSSEVGADPNFGAEADRARANPNSGAKADPNSEARADRPRAGPNSAAKVDLSSGARTMPAGPSSLAEKGLPSRSGRSLAVDSKEVGKRARVNSELGPRRNRGPRLLAAPQEKGKAGRAKTFPIEALKADPHSEIARRGPKGLVHRAESLVEVLVARGMRVPEPGGRISSDPMLRRGLEAREASARVPGAQAGKGAAEAVPSNSLQIPTGKGGMAPSALASATTAIRFSRTSATVIVYSSRCAS